MDSGEFNQDKQFIPTKSFQEYVDDWKNNTPTQNDIEDCQHPYRFLERNENGLFCKKCKMQISSDPNIY